MADNIPVTPGSGATVAADDVGGVLHQRVKLVMGGDGVSEGDVASSNPMPVSAPDLYATLESALLLLSAILEKLPRIDAADRLMVSHAESNPTVSIAASQTLATVTTVATVSTVSNQTNIGGRDAAHAAYALANMGTAHIYNQIIVS